MGKRKVDEIADAETETTTAEGSTVDTIRDAREARQSRLDEIMGASGMSPTRQNNPPQTGPGSQANDKENYD